MLKILVDYFLLEPKRIIGFGRFLSSSGFTLLMAGMLGRVAITAVSATAALGGRPANGKPLTEVFSPIPTWWIPESFIGFVLAVLLIAVGIWLILVGRQFVRVMNF